MAALSPGRPTLGEPAGACRVDRASAAEPDAYLLGRRSLALRVSIVIKTRHFYDSTAQIITDLGKVGGIVH